MNVNSFDKMVERWHGGNTDDKGPTRRLRTALFDLWKFGYNYGGIEVDVAGAMAESVTAYVAA
ncbi:MAG: hypothetical protein PVS3B3_23200 [Ktedonobacteraceae bacterium]